MDPKTLIIVVLLIVILYFVVKDYFSAKFNAIKSVLGAEFYGNTKRYDISYGDSNSPRPQPNYWETSDNKTFLVYDRNWEVSPLTQFTVDAKGNFSIWGMPSNMIQKGDKIVFSMDGNLGFAVLRV